LLLFVGVLLSVNLARYVALALGSPVWLRPAGVVAVIAGVTSSIAMLMSVGGRIAPVLLAPLGTMVVAVLLLRSAWPAFRRGGIMWRGTLYRIETLRAGVWHRFPWGQPTEKERS